MKKKWFYFLLVLAVFVGVMYLWRYKQSQIFEKRVPSFATKVINVNLRQIENQLLFDFLANPIVYIKSRKKKDSIKKTNTFLTKGVRIPKNILFYTNSEELKNNWFSSVIYLSNTPKFSAYLLEEKFKKEEVGDFVFYKKDKVILAIKNEQLIIALNFRKPSIEPSIFELLFNNQNFLNKNATELKPIVNSQRDVSFSFGDDFLEAWFSKGTLTIKGRLSSNLFIVNSNDRINKNGIVSYAGKINKNNQLFKQFYADRKDKFNELTHLSLDSIISKWNGKISMNITAIDQKIDTIVSYEYDDDFNKVEKKVIQKQNIPTLALKLGQENTFSLSNYFYRKNAIQVVENDTVFTAIPILKFLTTDTKETFVLKVNQEENSSDVSSVTSKLNFYFNVEKYQKKPLDIPLNKIQKKMVKLVKTTTLEWKENNQFFLEINLKDKNRNFLGQLLKP
ncbi:hypothetical protein EGM88_10875 [Aureibaculum marinum]|uniref:Uncharacterized protein n=1 Tax=Aureibaculum marinum TaxID=2487930 RepID=A0A3N4NKC3_9FLAO|nr:hypothetical protein [Aureibaculum marinum]RPD95965.1 hypothetical protein EGM88_10875 [Aureibaculum marinum]